MKQSTFIAWHRILGTALAEEFAGSPFAVDTELDLSFRQQRLDILIIRKLPGAYPGRLPDGLEGLVDYNLVTYKSLHEPPDVWSLDELLGHYVNYRKQVALPDDKLLPEEAFQLYGICTRFPQKLASRVALLPRQTGVYDVPWGARPIRIIVLSEIPAEPHNAIWALFSASAEKVVYGAEQMRDRMEQMSTVVNKLLENYELEGIPMSYTPEDFIREVTTKHLHELEPREVLQNYAADDLLRELGPEGILRNYSPDDLLREMFRGDFIHNVPVEELEAYLAQYKREQQQDSPRGKEDGPEEA